MEGVAVCFFRGSPQPRDQIQVSRIAGRFFTRWTTREAHARLTSWSNLYFRRVTLVAVGKLDWRFIEHAWRSAPEDFSWIHEFDAWHDDKTLLAISYSWNWSPGRWRSKMVEWLPSKELVSKINCFCGIIQAVCFFLFRHSGGPSLASRTICARCSGSMNTGHLGNQQIRGKFLPPISFPPSTSLSLDRVEGTRIFSQAFCE